MEPLGVLINKQRLSIVRYILGLYIFITAFALVYIVLSSIAGSPPDNPHLKFSIILVSLILSFFGYRNSDQISGRYVWGLFMILQTILATLLILLYGTTEGLSYLALATVIYSTSILYNHKVGLLLTLTSIITIAFISILHNQGYNPVQYDQIDSSYVNTFVLCFFLWVNARIASIGYGEIEGSYKYAVKYSKELEELNAVLDERVEERSKALEKSWEEKVLMLERNALLGKITENLLHDLKTPLSSLAISAEMAEDKFRNSSFKESADRELAIDSINSIQGAYHQLLCILDESEELMKRNDIKREFDISNQVRSVVKLVEPIANRVGIKLEIEITTKNVIVFGTPSLLYRAVLNLLLNSIEELTSLKGGHSGIDNNGVIQVNVKKNKKQVEICVKDNGRGIAKSDFADIFESGFSKKSEEKHYGLGLAFVKQVIQDDFSGSVSIESREGEYTLIKISLPIYES